MKRTDYETLAMEEIIVDVENGFLGGSVNINPTDEKIGEIKAHEVNTGFTIDFIGENEPGTGTNVW
jgi:hypothetical protein